MQSVDRLKIVVTGGHPGDPEYGCGGTIARYVAQGHGVAVLYQNIGETEGNPATVPGERKREAESACAILRARPVFADQVDGNTIVDSLHYASYKRILEDEDPDVVFAHWPIDNHPDHRANWLLVYDAWSQMGQSFALYYYEVTSGADTMMFSPTDYVDISEFEQLKQKACYAHSSQDPEHFYSIQSATSRFRGVECRTKHAEAFVRQANPTTAQNLPGRTEQTRLIEG